MITVDLLPIITIVMRLFRLEISIMPLTWVRLPNPETESADRQLQLLPPSMTTRGPGRRRPSTDNTYYHAVPQSPLAPNPVALSESLTGSLVLDPENDEDVIEETIMAVEVTPAIRWVHFIFGCAVLLPWNGMSSQNRRPAFAVAS